MKIAEIKTGDELENYRKGQHLLVVAIEPWSGGNGEIELHVLGAREILGYRVLRREQLTFRQFERLKFIRRWERS